MNPNNEILKRRGRPATGQAKTAAQRMQERRQRMKHGETGDRDKGGERQLTLILSLSALNALHRMAKRDGVTKKQFLDTLLRDTEDKLLQGFDEAELERYWSEAGSPGIKPLAPNQDVPIKAGISDIEQPPVQDLSEQQHEDAPAAAPIAEIPATQSPMSSRRNNKSGYNGVSFHKGKGKWQANLREDGKQLCLGSFNTAEEAHQARLAYLAKSRHRFNVTENAAGLFRSLLNTPRNNHDQNHCLYA